MDVCFCIICTYRNASIHINTYMNVFKDFSLEEDTAVCEHYDWFVYIVRRAVVECMSAALPCFGVACAVLTADYTGLRLRLDSSFSGVCVWSLCRWLCVCVSSSQLVEGLYRCSVTFCLCPHPLVACECVYICECVCAKKGNWLYVLEMLQPRQSDTV